MSSAINRAYDGHGADRNKCGMRIVGKKILADFAKKHPNTRGALERWYTLMKQGTFHSYVELRETFPHADPVQRQKRWLKSPRREKTVTFFNIGGNKARLAAIIDYDINVQSVTITKVETHAEYDKRR